MILNLKNQLVGDSEKTLNFVFRLKDELRSIELSLNTGPYTE